MTSQLYACTKQKKNTVVALQYTGCPQKNAPPPIPLFTTALFKGRAQVWIYIYIYMYMYMKALLWFYIVWIFYMDLLRPIQMQQRVDDT